MPAVRTTTYDESVLLPTDIRGLLSNASRIMGKEALDLFRETIRELVKNTIPKGVQDTGKTSAGLISVGLTFLKRKVGHVMDQLDAPTIEQSEEAAERIEVVDGKRMVVWLVHPTNYRRDGTPRKWKKLIVPSNAIGQLHALMPEKIDDGTEEGVPVDVHFLEDTAQPFDIRGIKHSMSGRDNKGLVMLSGVQTNQWPRAVDLASLCKKQGIPVIAGGYHVRADLPITRKQADELGMSLAIGEAEALIDNQPLLKKILQDLWAGELQPEYRQNGNPDIGKQVLSSIIPSYQQRMMTSDLATVETSRGCPYPCSFCTIRTIGGSDVRARDADNLNEWLQKAYKRGIRKIFITDDNFSKSRQRFETLEVLKRLRRRGQPIDIMIQADTMATRGPNGSKFVEACQEAGVDSVFLGMESVDPETLKRMNKPQNKPERYKEIVADWHRANIIALCGFIIGNQGERPGVGRKSADALLDMDMDIAAAYMRVPLPGSVDYHKLYEQGLITEADFNLYDCHTGYCVQFSDGLSRQEAMWEYHEFYRQFYSLQHFARLGRHLKGHSLESAIKHWIWYRYSIERGDHPMYSGFGRQPVDFLRSDFTHGLNPTLDDLAPNPLGPGAPENERNPKNRLHVI